MFFDLFETAARNVHQGAMALADLFEHYTDLEAKVTRIKEIEHNGDKITHDTILKLNQTFVTPLDRDDIYRLITRLDDIIDLIDGSVGRMVLYKIQQPTDDLKKLAAVLVGSTGILAELLPSLRHIRKIDQIQRRCIDVNTLENDGDQITQHALAALFSNHNDPATIIKLKDIYESLELATDRCEDVANIVESIALKNA